MKTVLITGCSTGFGQETATYFLSQGWRVIATMRNPAASQLPPSDALRVLALDVTDPDSIAAAIDAAGPIDVLVNNAGIGWLNAVEGTSMDVVRQIFETNTFATVALMKAVLPAMRERRAGVIVNVSSSTVYKPLPLLSIYRASKAAVNALTEAVALELDQFGIRVRAVTPGLAPGTAFASNAMTQVEANGGFAEAYADFTAQTFEDMRAHGEEGLTTSARDVAEAVYRAATDADCPMILPAGADAEVWARGE